MTGPGITRERGISLLIFLTAALVMAASFFFTGCALKPEVIIGGGGELTGRDTPGGLVTRFAEAQSDPRRDITEYGLCLHPQYGFFFTSSDAEVIGEDFWTKEKDVQSMQDLFNAATDIRVTASIEDTLETQPCDESTPTNLCTTYVVRIDMTVSVPDPQSHEPVTYLVNGHADFVISRDPANSTLYVIREIHDRTNETGRPAGVAGAATASSLTGSQSSSWTALRRLAVE